MKKEYETPKFEIVTFLSTDPIMADVSNGSDLDFIQSGLEQGSGEASWDSM